MVVVGAGFEHDGIFITSRSSKSLRQVRIIGDLECFLFLLVTLSAKTAKKSSLGRSRGRHGQAGCCVACFELVLSCVGVTRDEHTQSRTVFESVDKTDTGIDVPIQKSHRHTNKQKGGKVRNMSSSVTDQNRNEAQASLRTTETQKRCHASIENRELSI